MAFVPYPHLGHFRHLEARLRSADDSAAAPLPPVLRYRGTVKLHGANMAVSQPGPGAAELSTQSRNRLVDTAEAAAAQDPYGFAAFVQQRRGAFEELFRRIRAAADVPGLCHIFGEFAGQGVQKAVAVSAVPKFFCIFAVLVDGRRFLDLGAEPLRGSLRDVAACIFDVLQFGERHLELRRDDPSASTAAIVAATEEVCERCPAGAFLGSAGPGEGLVWQCLDALDDASLHFKSKGEAWRVSPEAPPPRDGGVDNRAKSFAAVTLTEARLSQAVTTAWEHGGRKEGKAAIGFVVDWASEDALREEGQDVPAEEVKAHRAALQRAARAWMLRRLAA